MTSSEAKKKQSKEKQKEDEFNTYLKNQSLRTTFNGIEIDSFSWYEKMLGVK